MDLNTVITTRPTLPAEAPNVVAQRTAYLRRRHQLSPALAAVIASLAYEVAPAWHGRRL